MEMSRDGIFMGRAVEVRVVSLGVLLDSHELAEKNPANQFIGGFYVLAHSLVWKETGDRVFANVEAVRDVAPSRARRHRAGRRTHQRQRRGVRPFPLKPETLFLHRLALALGKTVAEVRATMTAREFVDWQRFAIEHPFPADLIDVHGAMAFALLANINREAGAPPLDTRDFLLVRPGRNLAPPADEKQKPAAMSEADRMLSIF